MRELAAALGLAAAASGLALFTAGRTWSRLRVSADGMPAQDVTVTGTEALPWLPAAALVALACLGAVLVTRGWARRLVGVLLAVCGAALVVAAVRAEAAVTRAQRAGVEATAAAADSSVADTVLALDAQLLGWHWLLLGCGLVLVAAGVATAVRGPRWPAMGRRYERVQPAAADPHEPLAVWQELDEGRDPTR